MTYGKYKCIHNQCPLYRGLCCYRLENDRCAISGLKNEIASLKREIKENEQEIKEIIKAIDLIER